jgi:pimeloyl-ACP methyl ester carboxylesterase
MKKRIFKILRIILLTLIALVAVLSIRHYFKSKSDRELFADAYGEYYTTPEGERINYTFYDSSSDKVAVFLPGFGCSSAHYEFDSLAKDLGDLYKIVIVDPLGVGLSDETDRDRTSANYCAELHGLMQYLGYDSYTIIGHSIAGIYALDYTNRYPDEVEAFIGIDASIPKQWDICPKAALPENQYKTDKVLKYLLVNTGIYRFLTELSFDKYLKQIPTISEEERPIVKAMNCTDQLRPTQLREMEALKENSENLFNMKFPESIPVLYLISRDNCDMMPGWEDIHKDVTTNPESRVVVLDGGHYLHLENRTAVVNEILNWKY